MSKIIGYIFTPLFLLLFGGTLVLFHLPLMLAYNIFGYNAHKFVLECMNRSILWCLRFIGARFRFIQPFDLPTDRPLIVVSNHQSMYDVPILLLIFRKHHPKFVAKVELSKGIPSISYALRHMGSAIIDRKDQKQAIQTIQDFARTIGANNYCACIFPEGTRARDGKIKKFKFAGLLTLLKEMPEALIVPVVVSRSWELLRYKFWPVPYGIKVTVKALPPLDPRGLDPKNVCSQVEQQIHQELAIFEPAALDGHKHGQNRQTAI